MRWRLVAACLLLWAGARPALAQVKAAAGAAAAAVPVPAVGQAASISNPVQLPALPALKLGDLSPALLPAVQIRAAAPAISAPTSLPASVVPSLPQAIAPVAARAQALAEPAVPVAGGLADRRVEAPSPVGAPATVPAGTPAGAQAAGPLEAQRPAFAPGLVEGIKRANAALEAAVQSTARAWLAPGSFEVLSRGSSARLTFADGHPDYDLMVRLPESWTQEQFTTFMKERLPELKQSLAASVTREAADLYPGSALQASVGDPVALTDPATGKPAPGVYMLPVKVRSAAGAMLLDIDVSFTIRPDYANPYPRYFAGQLGEVVRLGGQAAADAVLADIRLAKRLFVETLGSYKSWHGGPSGVGVEQLIMQSGRVEDNDAGRTILEPGSFDKFMARVDRIGFDGRGQPRGLKKAAELWKVHNPFMAPDNFLSLMSESGWSKLAQAARKYQAAKAEGRALTFAELRPQRAAPPAPQVRFEPEVPIVEFRPAVVISIGWRSAMNPRRTELLAAAVVRELKAKGIKVLSARLSRVKNETARGYAVRLELDPSAETGAAVAEFSRLLGRRDASARLDGAAAPAVEAPTRPTPGAVLLLRPLFDAESPKLRRRLEKTAERFARGLGITGRVEVNARPDASGAYQIFLALDAGGDRQQFARAAAAFFTPASGFSVAGVAFPGAASETTDRLGALTLKMLDRFTTSGPRPEARGAEFLYAQGAKALPGGLERAWQAKPAEVPPVPRVGGPDPGLGAAVAGPETEIQRTLLLRRGTKTYVLMPAFNAEGMPIKKPVKVPERLAQGIISDTLVEVVFSQGKPSAVRSIGAYPGDMIIGRVVAGKAGLTLESLFRENGKAKGLYEALPLERGAAEARAGDLVQVFVRPAASGFAAVPILNLGRSLTPEIAAREIALRHGARGFFEADVIRQAEAIGREQDPAADFARLDAAHAKVEDLSGLPFITIDPKGAGDLDDAFYVEKGADGSFTWYLATADVAQYVKPGTPAFAAAAKVGNTFYSIDKDGVPEFPMNHPVVSKHVASLLAGKDSLGMITRMRFSPTGEFLLDQSDMFLGKVRVQGRYSYDQVAKLWEGGKDHGIAHVDQVSLARELAGKLSARDAARGKLNLSFMPVEHRPQADGTWKTEVVKEDPRESESHKLIEELKVYGNRVIATRLTRISSQFEVPHISRVHPEVEQAANDLLRDELKELGVPWPKEQTLWQYLAALKAREDISAERKEAAQILALRTRNPAIYAVEDTEGHEGLALQAGEYDHPSTPIRRFADMYNQSILEAYLAGRDPRVVRDAVEADLRRMGFADLAEYMQHLNGREQASKQMDLEVDAFMSVYELAKPENRGRTFSGYVKVVRKGRNAQAVVQLREMPVTITLEGERAEGLRLLDEVTVTVKGADAAELSVDAAVAKRR